MRYSNEMGFQVWKNRDKRPQIWYHDLNTHKTWEPDIICNSWYDINSPNKDNYMQLLK